MSQEINFMDLDQLFSSFKKKLSIEQKKNIRVSSVLNVKYRFMKITVSVICKCVWGCVCTVLQMQNIHPTAVMGHSQERFESYTPWMEAWILP